MSRKRQWHAEPEFGNEAVQSATGRTWDAWCDVLDDRPDKVQGHTAIAAYLRDTHELDPWWSQTVTGGYERISGLRRPYERPDGTFTASKSKTITFDAAELRSLLLDDEGRTALFPGQSTTLRSGVDAKSIRIEIGPGVAQFGISAASDASDGTPRAKVVVQHEQLPAYELVEQWQLYWAEWFDAIGARAARQ